MIGPVPSVNRIDAHQHFWQYNRERDAWITDEMRVIQRDFFPEDLLPHVKTHALEGTVAVQADQSEAETRFLLELANQHPFIKGVVGWLDLRSPSIESRLEHFSQFRKLKGLRHVVQAEPTGFLLHPDFQRGIAALRTYSYTYDILIREHQLEEAIAFVTMFPEQKFVVDHIAKPNIRNGNRSTWSKQMTELAKRSNVLCKLSGMVTEADWKNWKRADFTPYLDLVVNAFGTQRVMYGSDWPVCLVAGTYADQFSIVEEFLAPFSDSEKQAILHENAVRFYNL